jgi:triosephosphate isomerase
MAMDRLRPLVAGNWKMNGTRSALAVLESIKAGLRNLDAVDVAVCPPATLISRASVLATGSRIAIGGQDCHAEEIGAHTGDLSAEMIADAGGKLIIVGHSERRLAHHEDNQTVCRKVAATWRARLYAIACIGETAAEREAGQTLDVLSDQLAGSLPDGASGRNLVVAYEPVWAIGSGLTPTTAEIAEAQAHIRRQLADRFGGTGEEIRILYGGSVKPDNAAEIAAVNDVGGALVGGASLKAADFVAVVSAFGSVG